ncbi:proline-rich protein 36 [Notolabrus celidotus]|uniref:proline-rich protein 36 n=1 Tax=Notolabrus celidotus TaxID=1203425 RepID=UPI00149083C8|nr:proline-rich protein 36 [Notolabrus celidotus]
MKRRHLNFLGRKSNSLFDTNVKMKDMDDVELVLESSAIPESGTASVRARPTVKHHTSTNDSFQGFAVPTPKVPLLPPVNGPKINGSVGGNHLSNGSVMSVFDLAEEDIFVPPPPSTAAPPPPGSFIPPQGTFIPPPDFMGDLSTLDLSTLQHPSMPAPNPPSLAPSMQGKDLTFLKPPPMAPPKPPSTSPRDSMSSMPISSPQSPTVPGRPQFAPPQPPTERQLKMLKTPPPKPIRLSSISNIDSPPQSPAPPPPVQTPTLSSFNPQNTAKLYNVPTTSILKSYKEPEPRPMQKLLLEDSSSGKTSPVLVVDGNVPKGATLSKPVLKDAQELKDNLQIVQPPQTPLPEPKKEAKTATVSTPPISKPLRHTHQTLPSLPKVNSTSVNSVPSKDKLEVSPSPGHTFSPLLDRKLRNLKSSETNGAREGPAASPLALLMAAKKREKHRTTNSLSRENSDKRDEQPSANIHSSDSSPNSFVVTPRSSSSSSLASQERVQESPQPVGPGNHTQTIQTPEKLSSSALFKGQMPQSSPGLNRRVGSPSLTNLLALKQNKEQGPSKSQSSYNEESKGDISMPVLPPPPEFDDLDDIVGPPPSITPPDPPRKMAPAPTFNPPPPPPPPPLAMAPAPIPPPPPKPKPPQAPKLPSFDTDVKPKLQAQTKPKVGPSHLPSNLSPSQVTLLSILQKKMAEMDHKMTSTKETEANSDDWGNPLSDEDNKVPSVPKVTPLSKNNLVVTKSAGLDMRELEGKMVRKHQDTSSVKSPTSNGVHSKHQYGTTFTVRPGTKNPISPYRGES